jgi:uncharacterized membrane protein (DUF373 family)
MSPPESLRPEADRWDVRAFTVVEGIVYFGLGSLLTGIAFTLLITGFITFGQIALSAPVKHDFVDLLDQILLILLVVGMLYTVKVSLRGHALAPEPFLLIGLISVIRRVLILSAKFGNWHEKTSEESQHIMIELAVNTVLILILAVSLLLLRKADASTPSKHD